MSERYGPCPRCNGKGCLSCDGTGADGSAITLLEGWQREDWERDTWRAMPWRDRPVKRMLALIEATEKMISLPHVEVAVKAVETFLAAQRKHEGVPMQFKADEPSGLGQFLVKLKDKESIVGIFRGEPHDFRQHWMQNRSQICPGAGCNECIKGMKPSFRFRLNFVIHENGRYVARVFEQGRAVYGQLASLNNSGYPLEKTVVKVTRTGNDKATVYTILPLPAPQGTLTPEKEKALAAVTLHDLVNLDKHLAQMEQAADQFPMDDIPF